MLVISCVRVWNYSVILFLQYVLDKLDINIIKIIISNLVYDR